MGERMDRRMQANEIGKAIEKARKGISQYLEIMHLFPLVNTSTDRDFQKKFNGFYRIRQRSKEWYDVYFSYMEKGKKQVVLFDNVLDHIHEILGRYEPSFSSKLVATLYPNQPVWDSFIIKNTGQEAPSYTAKYKFEKAKIVFQNIREWYARHIQSEEGRLMISTFDRLVEEHEQVTDLKKIDFILWQTR